MTVTPADLRRLPDDADAMRHEAQRVVFGDQAR